MHPEVAPWAQGQLHNDQACQDGARPQWLGAMSLSNDLAKHAGLITAQQTSHIAVPAPLAG
jgi:hypothetical protein